MSYAVLNDDSPLAKQATLVFTLHSASDWQPHLKLQEAIDEVPLFRLSLLAFERALFFGKFDFKHSCQKLLAPPVRVTVYSYTKLPKLSNRQKQFT